MKVTDEDWKALVAESDCAATYAPLEEREFRILLIHPGEPDESICCQLVKQHLDKIQQSYVALSYTWGSSTRTNLVRCIINDSVVAHVAIATGKGGPVRFAEFAVTDNLLASLRRFRQTDQPTAMWIDAMCIDQASIAEKSKQIRLMAEIYARAEKTAIWLGEASDVSDAGLSFLDNLLSSRTEDGTGVVIMSPQEAAARSYLRGVGDVLNRSWFRRVWVRQELVFSRDAGLVCGQRTFAWDAFERVLPAFLRTREAFSDRLEPVYGLHHTNMLSMMRALVRATYSQPEGFMLSEELLVYLSLCRECESTDPRDKVFSVLGMCTPAQQKILPSLDYSLSCQEVFLRVALASILMYRKLGVLSHAGVGGKSTSKLTDLPTWVPDWSAEWPVTVINTPLPDHGYRAAADTLAEPQPVKEDRGSLKLIGRQVDEIDHLAEPTPSFEHLFTTQKADLVPSGEAHLGVHRWALSLDALREHIGGSSEVLWRTLCVNKARRGHRGEIWQGLQIIRVSERCVPAPVEYACSFEAWQRVNLPPPDSRRFTFQDTEDLKEWQTAMISAVRNRRFAVSKSRRMVLAPADVRPGDLICVLLGGNVPFVLRPHSGGWHELVGECFVHDLMNGEAIEDRILASQDFILR